MYRHLTLRVLFESCMFREYKYWSRNRWLYIVLAQCNNKLMAYGLNALTTPLQDIPLYWGATIQVPPYMASIYCPMTSCFVLSLRSMIGVRHQANPRPHSQSARLIEAHLLLLSRDFGRGGRIGRVQASGWKVGGSNTCWVKPMTYQIYGCCYLAWRSVLIG